MDKYTEQSRNYRKSGGIGVVRDEHRLVPFFAIDFGRECTGLFAQFAKYQKITLIITTIDAFVFNYTVHGDTLRKHGADSCVLTVGGKKHDILFTHEFQVTIFPKRAKHLEFVSALEANNGVWVLVVQGSTTLRLIMDSEGKIVARIEMPRA